MFWFLHGVHLFSVIIAVGGSFVLWFAVLPRLGEGELGTSIREAILARWRLLVWTCIVLITISGLANAHQAYGVVGKTLLYWIPFLVKFFLAMLLFGIALMITLPMKGFAKAKENRRKWMRHIVELATIIVFLSAFLRFMHNAMPTP